MKRPLLSIAMLCLLLARPVIGQVDVERFNRQIEQIQRDTRLLVNPSVPVDQRSYFDYGAYFTFNYLSLDEATLNNRALRQYDLTAYGRLNIDGVHEIFVRGRAFYRDFNDGDSFDSDVNGWDGRVERAYYQFDLGRYMAGKTGKLADGNVIVKVGRDLAYWGNGLVLSEELDGGMIDLSAGPATLDLLAGRTPSDTFDIDSSRPGFDGHTNRMFLGAMLSARAGVHRPYIYALVQRDHNGNDVSTDGSIVTRYDYNSYYFGIGSTGALTDRLAYGLEAAYEAGDTLSNSAFTEPDPNAPGSFITVPQSRDDVQAWALDGQLNYLLPDTRHTRLSGEFILASGDSDRVATTTTLGGNQPGTVDHAFNAFGLLNTGLAFAPNVSNLISLRGGVSLFPWPDVKSLSRLQVGTDVFVFSKWLANAPIDEATTNDHYLGFEPDVYLNWQITSDVTLAVRYGAFVPGAAIVNNGEIRQFFYTGVTFAF
ncbi:MAG TPA: alginate export family protein [Tepidisphaeraceae bacterium]|nr:alginate export family protein [Tepidisphaeraceae bacterium]